MERHPKWCRYFLMGVGISLAWLLSLTFVQAQEREVLQVDERCVVTVLNRAVYADEDGTFVLPNVPATQGNIKANVTCFWDEGVVSAESDYFALVNGGITDVIQFYRGPLDPVPVELVFTHASSYPDSSDVLLTSANATFQVSVAAHYSDDSIADVTTVPGINYASSTPSVATISDGGVVTALTSGSALITARKDGVLSAFSVNIVTSGDADGDGLPDDFESTNGLNLNDPIDALEDQDRDGLTAFEEFGFGTGVNSSDSDGDGLSDGEEVLLGDDGFVTNPLLPDTDGDGVSDPLEVTAGSDPTDSESIELSNILFSLDVTPASQQVLLNDIDSEARIDLDVIGLLIDGSEINLTDRLETTYDSSDFSMCSFGSVRGEVIFTSLGNCSISVSYGSSSLTSIAIFEVEPFTPEEVSRVDLTSGVKELVVNRNALYALVGNELQIYNVLQLGDQILMGQIPVMGQDLYLDGNSLYVAADDGVYVYDVSLPFAPVQSAFIDSVPAATQLVVKSGYLYVFDVAGQLRIFDVQQTNAISLVSDVSISTGNILTLDVESDLGLLVFYEQGLGFGVVDVSNQAAPILQSSGYLPEITSHKIVVEGYIVFAAHLDGGVVTFDVSDLSNPIELDRTLSQNAGAEARALVKRDGLLFNGGIFRWSFIAVINAEVPQALSINSLLTFETPDSPRAVTALAVDNEYVYFSTDSYVAVWSYRSLSDSDSDGLADVVEVEIGTLVDVFDSDGDGLSDGFEYFNALDPLTLNDVSSDVDDDSLSLIEEFQAGTNPNNSDTDVDGLTDGFEINNGFDPLNNLDGLADDDNDGLSYSAEISAGTDVNNSDTDNDGLGDGFEVTYGFDPLSLTTTDGDADADGLDLLGEFSAGTSPVDSDTDNDGLSDGYEVSNGFDPLNSADGLSDSDRDGLSYAGEINIGTDPSNPDTDNDRLTDGEEVILYLSDPLLIDTDSDGITDEVEVEFGLNPSDFFDAFLDLDSDGLTNLDESNLGTFLDTVDTDGDSLNDYDEWLLNKTEPQYADTDEDGVNDDVDIDKWLYYYVDRQVKRVNGGANHFAAAFSFAGDVNNDGYEDFIVGDPHYDDKFNYYYQSYDEYNFDVGRAQVFSGADGSLLYTFNGEFPEGRFGGAVSGAGDVNGDGFADVIVGAAWPDSFPIINHGRAYVFSGADGSVLHNFHGEATSDFFGDSVSGVGDLNGDGYADVIVGASGTDDNGERSGSAHVFSGLDGTVLYNFYGVAGGELFGQVVNNAGDVNADGVGDIIVASNLADTHGSSSGVVRVMSGADGELLYEFSGADSFERFGVSVSGAGDVNGDGFADIVVGAELANNTDNWRGRVRVFSGADGEILYTFEGQYHFDRLGRSVSGAGDVNLDGFDDIVVGGIHEGRDGIRVFSGESGRMLFFVEGYGSSVKGGKDIDSDGYPDLLMHTAEQSLGVVSLGLDPDLDGLITAQDPEPFIFTDDNSDSDGDGLGDLLEISLGYDPLGLDSDGDGIADPLEHNGLTDALRADTDGDGINDGEDSDNDWLYFYNGESARGGFGHSVSGAGDVDNDGIPDVIVGIPRRGDGGVAGQARVYSGGTGMLLYTFNGSSIDDGFGGSVSGAGDVNADGFADVIVGASRDDTGGTDAGRAQVFSGADGSILYTFNGSASNDLFGGSVSSAGDVNNDGFADVVIGIHGESSNGTGSGAAQVISGVDGSIIYTFTGEFSDDAFGSPVSGAGDVNNDGYSDVLVGATGSDYNGENSGNARIFSGADGSVLFNFNGNSAGDAFGGALGAAGDVNADGIPDVIVGAADDDTNGPSSGSAQVFSGADGSILYTFTGGAVDDYLGSAVSGAGDVNRDGFADLIVGARGDDTGGINAGNARIISGADGSVILSLDGYSADAGFGYSVSGIGDINNDGFDEVIIGSDRGAVRIVSPSELVFSWGPDLDAYEYNQGDGATLYADENGGEMTTGPGLSFATAAVTKEFSDERVTMTIEFASGDVLTLVSLYDDQWLFHTDSEGSSTSPFTAVKIITNAERVIVDDGDDITIIGGSSDSIIEIDNVNDGVNHIYTGEGRDILALGISFYQSRFPMSYGDTVYYFDVDDDGFDRLGLPYRSFYTGLSYADYSSTETVVIDDIDPLTLASNGLGSTVLEFYYQHSAELTTSYESVFPTNDLYVDGSSLSIRWGSGGVDFFNTRVDSYIIGGEIWSKVDFYKQDFQPLDTRALDAIVPVEWINGDGGLTMTAEQNEILVGSSQNDVLNSPVYSNDNTAFFGFGGDDVFVISPWGNYSSSEDLDFYAGGAGNDSYEFYIDDDNGIGDDVIWDTQGNDTIILNYSGSNILSPTFIRDGDDAVININGFSSLRVSDWYLDANFRVETLQVIGDQTYDLEAEF